MPDNMPYQDTYIDEVKTTIPVTAVTIVTTDMHLQSPPAINGSYNPISSNPCQTPPSHTKAHASTT